MFNLIRKRREMEGLGPGTYNLPKLDSERCLVKYTRSHSPRITGPPERAPSPTRYYAKDDLIHPSMPTYTFNKDGMDKRVKLKDLDFRRPLNVNMDAVKPRIPGANINPEHK